MYKSPADYKPVNVSGAISNIFVLDETGLSYTGDNAYTSLSDILTAAASVTGTKILFFTSSYDMVAGTYDFSDWEFIAIDEGISLYVGSYSVSWILSWTGFPKKFENFANVEFAASMNSIYSGPAVDFEVINANMYSTDSY
jgi:hypothetical protein